MDELLFQGVAIRLISFPGTGPLDRSYPDETSLAKYDRCRVLVCLRHGRGGRFMGVCVCVCLRVHVCMCV